MAIFQPSHVVPDMRSGIGFGTIDATQGLTVSWRINGNSALTSFSITIYNNDAQSTQKYTTGQITSGCPAYGTSPTGDIQIFSYTIPAATLASNGITNGNEYKLIIKQWWSANDSVTQSSASVFETRATPSLVVNNIRDTVTVSDVTADIVPVQTFNGYDHPWAGGDGINQLDYTQLTPSAYSNMEIVSDGVIRVTQNTSNANCFVQMPLITLDAGHTYTLSCVANATVAPAEGYRIAFVNSAGTTLLAYSDRYTDTGIDKPLVASYTPSAETTVRIRIFAKNGGGAADTADVTFSQIMLTVDNPTATYEPYENICPISGRNSVTVKQTNENLIYYTKFVVITSASTRTFVNNGIRVTQNAAANNAGVSLTNLRLKAGHTYTLSCVVNAASVVASGWRIAFVNSAGNAFLANSPLSMVTNVETPVSVSYTPTQDTTAILRLFAKNGGGSNTGADVTFTNIMLRVDDASADYVPYQGNTYTVSFGSAGTVYKGDVNVSTGDLSVTWDNIASYAGETLPGEWISDRDVYVPGGTPTTGAQVVYEVASPSTYQLTPASITPVSGQNHMWSNIGDISATVTENGISQTFSGNIISFFGGVDGVISTRYYTFGATYAQAQGDLLNWYRWQIAYADDTAHPLFDTGNISGTMNVSCYYDGFLNNTEYSIRLTAQTESGITIDTGWIDFTAQYDTIDTSSVITATCVNGTDAILISWNGIGYIPGTSSGDYSIENNILQLPAGSSVEWSEQDSKAISFAPAWSVIYRGQLGTQNATVFTIAQGGGDITLSYDYATATLTLAKGGTTIATQAGVINSPVLTVILTDDTLYLRTDYMGGGLYPSNTLYPGSDLYPADDDLSLIGIFTLSPSYTQEAITSVSLGGYQFCDYLEIVSGDPSADTITAAVTNGVYAPGLAETDYMMIDFSRGLNAGTLNIGADTLQGYALYRRSIGGGDLVKVAETDADTYSAYDYGATSQQGPYVYELFPIGANTYISNALESGQIAPCWWNWTLMECEATADANIFTVIAAYRFKLNVETGAVSNNNTPTVLQNFTRYPTVQLAPQNYKSGSLSGLIGAVDWSSGQPEYIDTLALRDALYALSTSQNAMFLKNRKGDLLRVRVSAPVSMQTLDATAEQAQMISLPWVEVGTTRNVSLYSLTYDGTQAG